MTFDGRIRVLGADLRSRCEGWEQKVRLCSVPAQLVAQILAGADVESLLSCDVAPGLVHIDRRSVAKLGRRRVLQLWRLAAIAADPLDCLVEFVGLTATNLGRLNRRSRRKTWRKKRRKS